MINMTENKQDKDTQETEKTKNTQEVEKTKTSEKPEDQRSTDVEGSNLQDPQEGGATTTTDGGAGIKDNTSTNAKK